jgi:RNA polymerase sigma factor (sigma-70 family)
LVRGARDANVASFEAIFDRYHRRILSFCRHMLGSREDGEDATQQVFVAAHRDLCASSKDIDLRPWLFAIARNRCLDMLRARRATDSLDAAPHDPPALDGLPEVVQRREDLRALVADIGALPEAQREALVLFELGGLSQRKLAEVLDCRPEQVKALVFQARTSLMADRQARAAACQGIREEIAAGRGHDLLRSQLRRHLRVCPACRDFADRTRHQRAALALVLPVLPTAGLKAATLAAAGAGAAGAVAGPAVGGGVAGGLGGVLGKGLAVKVLAVLSIAGATGGLAYTLVHRATTAPPASATEQRAASGASSLAPAVLAGTALTAGKQAVGGSRHQAAPARRHRSRVGTTHHPVRHAAAGRGIAPVLARRAHVRSHGLRRTASRNSPAPATTQVPQSSSAPSTSSSGSATLTPVLSSSRLGELGSGTGQRHHHPQHPQHPATSDSPAAPQSDQSAGHDGGRDGQGHGNGGGQGQGN